MLSKPHASVLNFLRAKIPLEVRPGIIRHSASRIDHSKVIFPVRKIASKIMNKLLLVSARSNRGFRRIWATHCWLSIILCVVVIESYTKWSYYHYSRRNVLAYFVFTQCKMEGERSQERFLCWADFSHREIVEVICAICVSCELLCRRCVDRASRKPSTNHVMLRFLFQPPVKESLALVKAITFNHRQGWYNVAYVQQETHLVWFSGGIIVVRPN